MKATELQAHLGKVGTLRLWHDTMELGSSSVFCIPVTVIDVRYVFGRLDFLVTPTVGSGQQWVEARRVQLPE
mgnify:CR=1 FL=1